MSDDLLDRILDLAQRERPFDAEALRAFAQALRDRARLILDERIRPLEERTAALAKETGWRAETIAALEAERAALKSEIDALRVDRNAAGRAHETLLDHHRGLVEQLIEALEALTPQLGWGSRRAKEKIAALVAALRKEGA